VLDQRGRLLVAALGFAGLPRPSYDRALHAVRSWLDSWSGIGHVAIGMARQGYDLQLTRYDERGWRATFYMTGMEHSPTSATGTGWERTPVAREAAGGVGRAEEIRAGQAMMRPRRASVIALLLLAGCTSGSLIGALPAVPDPSLAANVVIVRPFSVFGSARRPTITIDGTDTYDIGPGEHVAIPVAPGERFVGMRIWDLVTIRGAVKINAERGRTYYFVVSPGTTITEVSEAEGRALLADTQPLGRWGR
jgi:hypothetical protein